MENNNTITTSMDDLVLYADVLQSLISHHEGRKKLARPKGSVVCDIVYLDELNKNIITHVFEAANAEEVIVVFNDSIAFPSKYKSIRQFFKFFLKTVGIEDICVNPTQLDFDNKAKTTLSKDLNKLEREKPESREKMQEKIYTIKHQPSSITIKQQEPLNYQILRSLIAAVKEKTDVEYLHIVKARMLFVMNVYIQYINKNEDVYYVEELVGDLYDALRVVVDDPVVYIKDFINLDGLSTEQGIDIGVEYLNKKEFYIKKEYEDMNNMEKHLFWLWAFSNPDNTIDSIAQDYGFPRNKVSFHYNDCIK